VEPLMPARNPDYRPPPDFTPAFCENPLGHDPNPIKRNKALQRPGCGKLLRPNRAGLCNDCAGKLPEAVRCKRCGSVDRRQANGCPSHFHAENREEAGP